MILLVCCHQQSGLLSIDIGISLSYYPSRGYPSMSSKSERKMRYEWFTFHVRYHSTDGSLKPVTMDYLNLLMSSQGDRCKCCQEPAATPDDLKLNWNWDTGIVRGLVCYRCQLILDASLPYSSEWPDSPDRIRSLKMNKKYKKDGDYLDKVATFATTTLPPIVLVQAQNS